jgi:dihydrofolate reductase
MIISIIAALDKNRGIGKDNKIPWRIREDLIRLRKMIEGHVVILGRKTFDSIVFYYNRSGKEMPAKLYVVVTRDESYIPIRPNATVAHSIEEAIALAKEKENQEIFILGGQKIFEQMIAMVNRLYLTVVQGEYDADAFFPEYEDQFNKVIFQEDHEENGIRYKYLTLER